jgi:hypothetical protein
MRHLGSFLLSMVLAPAIWITTGIGLSKFGEGLTNDPDYLAAFVGMVALGIAGALLAVLIMVRLSPVGPVLAGLGYFGATMWGLSDPGSFQDMIPQDLFGVANAGWIPSAGVAALLAVPLIATIASPRRWRRYARPDAGTYPTVYGTPAATPPTFSAAPTYPTPPPVYPPPVYDPEDTKPLPPGG